MMRVGAVYPMRLETFMKVELQNARHSKVDKLLMEDIQLAETWICMETALMYSLCLGGSPCVSLNHN